MSRVVIPEMDRIEEGGTIAETTRSEALVDEIIQANTKGNSTVPLFVLLTLVAAAALIYGFFQITQMTWGVGVIAAGCLLAIFARIVQAGIHHRALMDELRRRS